MSNDANNRDQSSPKSPLDLADTASLPRGLGLYEPTTAITDFLLALMAFWFAHRLLQSGTTGQARRAWGLGFLATAFAALAGGLSHGFGPRLPRGARVLLWKLTMIGTGLTSFFMLAGTVYATVRHPWRLFWLALVTAKSLVYARWISRENDFRYVVYDYVSAMLAVLTVHLVQYKTRPAARAIVQGIGISFLAAAIQQIGINIHTHFNKNDLYHVIQALGFALFYRGAGRLDDAE